MVKEHWIFLFTAFLALFSFAGLLSAGVFGFAEAYFRELSEKRAKKSLLPAKMFRACRALTIACILSIIATQVFFILLAWLPLGKWDIWITVGTTILIGILTRVWAWKSADGEEDPDKMLYWLIALILVFLVLLFMSFIALVSEGPKLQAIFQALE
jgi:MFS family permease